MCFTWRLLLVPKKGLEHTQDEYKFFPILKHLLLKGFLRSIAHFNKKFLYFPLNRYVEWCDGDIYRDIGNFDLEISVRVVSDMLECVRCNAPFTLCIVMHLAVYLCLSTFVCTMKNECFLHLNTILCITKF